MANEDHYDFLKKAHNLFFSENALSPMAFSSLKKFEAEPLMRSYTVMGIHIDPLKIYDVILGPTLLVLGLTILLGIASRTSLFLLGLLYISLTWGLILIKQDDGVSWLGVHMILIVMALMLSKYNRCAIFKKW